MFLFSSSRICFLIFVLCSLNLISAEVIQDATKWMCADEKCSVPISLSTTTKKYVPDDAKKIKVNVGDKVQVLRKPADPTNDYYFVKSLVTNKKGLLKQSFFRETKIFHPERDLIEVELTKKSAKNPTPNISPSAPTNVYDGTTIIEPYEDAHYVYEPTQAQEQLNNGGSSSVVQSTTPPSVVGDSTLLKENSGEVFSRNASEGEQESDGISSQPTRSSGLPTVPEILGILDDQKLDDDGIGISSTPASTINNEPSQLPDIANDASIASATTDVPTSHGTIQIDKSQTHDNGNSYHEATNDVGEEIDADDVQLDATKEAENLLNNVASTIKSMFPFGNDDSTDEPVKQELVDQMNDSSASIVGEPQAAVNSDVDSDVSVKSDPEPIPTNSSQDATSVDEQAVSGDPVEQQEIPEQPLGQVAQGKPLDEQLSSVVSTDESEKEPKSPDSSVEHSNENNELDNKPPELINPDNHKNLSDPVPGDITGDDLTSNLNQTKMYLPNGVPALGENSNLDSSHVKSDSLPAYPRAVATDPENLLQQSSNLVVQELSDIPSAEQNETIIESNEPPLESMPSDARSSDAFDSGNNRVKYEQLPAQPSFSEDPALDPDADIEISADSEEDDSNINFESLKSTTQSSSNDPVRIIEHAESESGEPINATAEQSDSVSTTNENIESRKVVEEPTSPFSSNLDFVDPRLSNPVLPSSSPGVDLPIAEEITEMPINVPETTSIPQIVRTTEPIPPDDKVMVTTPPSEPSDQLVPEPSPGNIEIQKNSFEETSKIVQEDSSDPWYSGIFSVVDTIQEMFSSSDPQPEVVPSDADTPEVIPEFQADEKSKTCNAETCNSPPQINPEIEQDDNYLVDEYVWMTPRGMILMTITAVAVLLFSLGHYYLENLKRDVELVSKYNDLAGKLFIEQKEKEMLADQLASVNESMTQISFDTTKYDEEISDLKALVKKYKDDKSAIEEKEKETRKKFMMVEKNYNELRNILSQNKQKGERSALIMDIKNLKESIAGNNIEIASLKEQLQEKKEEIKSLNARIVECMETNKLLEQNLEKAISENHDTAQKYQDNIAKLEKTIEESTVARVKLEKECTQLKKAKESLAIEKELAESSLQKFQRLKPSNSLTEWLDAKEVRVSLLAAEKKIEELTTIVDNLSREKTVVEEKDRMLVADLEQLNEKYEKAEKDKIEALTKLQVLSDYFKEKETQLQEELGTKESLWLQKQSDDRTIYEQMRALREENASFKNQNETLKREILDQEASFKKLITSADEKAHENWVALRHLERRLKEAQMEASQLRSRLTALEASGDNSDDKMNKGEVNGDIPPFGSATSPPFMLYPEFVPPPPLLPNTPSRPPPLGRISSPPLGDFTPPPPLAPYEMFLPPSPPPPAPHILHKPQPLDGSHRIQKDSQSSNHSSESVPDRPRRNKR